VKCPLCNTEHELLEPTFRRPDAVVRMPQDERARRVEEGDDLCRIAAGGGDEISRFFLRTVLPIRLTDIDNYTHWGLWVEVEERHARRAWELWDSPDQAKEPPFTGCVANEIAGYPDTIGLPVQVRLTGPSTRPCASFEADVVHPFAEECRQGVSCGRVLEWLGGTGCTAGGESACSFRLELEDGTSREDPSTPDLVACLDRVGGTGTSFATLQRADGHFVQACVDASGQWVLEWQRGGLDRHFACSKVTLERAEVVAAFTAFLSGDEDGLDALGWERMEL
jgi:hypothetical protein